MSNAENGKHKIVNLLNELKYLTEQITGYESDREISAADDGSSWTLRTEKECEVKKSNNTAFVLKQK